MDVEKKIKSDFRYFLFLIWKHLNLPDPTPIQYDMAQYLQHGGKRTIIEAFRGVGKSWITSAFVVWLLYCNPQLKILVVSASKERADQFSIFTKRLIAEVDFLTHLSPRQGQRDSIISFDVAPARTDHSPSVKSVGITGQLTGSRADIIIGDDIEVANNSTTQDSRDKLAEAVKEFDAILKPLKASRIIYLGTPQTEMSLYNVLAGRGYEIRIWCSRKPTETEIIAYGGRLAPFILGLDTPVGHTTDPLRFSDADLEEREISYGKAGFALQFMLDTSLSDANKFPLKLSDLIVDTVDNKAAAVEYTWTSMRDKKVQEMPLVGLAGDRYYMPMWKSDSRRAYTGKVMVIDPSGRGRDETAYCIGYMLNGYIFLSCSGGMTDGYSDKTLKELMYIAKRHGVHEILIEGNFGDGMFIKLLSPHMRSIYPVTLSEAKNQTNKEKRMIDTLEPVLMQHRLIVDPQVILNDYESTRSDIKFSLFYQMSRVTYEKGALRQDDRLDCLAMMVQYWQESLDADARESETTTREGELQAELDKFVSECGGNTSSVSNWIYY
jgi:hypothetical protein